MSSDIAVRVRNLSKRYSIAHDDNKHTTLAESLLARLKHPLKRALREEFWALRDVNFEIKKGEVVGIIGRNGAGKSTLLKVLSRITEPTSGKVELYGHVGSLLEVGTGFHPELTGRENIYLNGAILGMRKKEIRRQFDAIVDFADVEKFLDTPVKRYSSGMYVRLAFAVAANLNPEILIIDEVLAVGDAQFQKKCLGKMGEVAKAGRTVLFVSHNMNAVESLCGKIIRLDRGRVAEVSDNVREAVIRYHTSGAKANESPTEWRNTTGEMQKPAFQPTRFYIGKADGGVASMPVRNDEELYVYIEGNVHELDNCLNVGYAIFDSNGSLLYWTTSTDGPEDAWPRFHHGEMVLRSPLPARLLNEGQYRVELLVSIHQREWISRPESNAPGLELAIHGGLSDSPYWTSRRPGVMAPVCPWLVVQQSRELVEAASGGAV
jgi:lipopolysaccharide transport system ATP-binding protein